MKFFGQQMGKWALPKIQGQWKVYTTTGAAGAWELYSHINNLRQIGSDVSELGSKTKEYMGKYQELMKNSEGLSEREVDMIFTSYM